ncbi:unnamed protein product [Owenia fusiformis]|uniref:Uncharacterized protein n=1 Tax=Owenia fusiformis TaxID=6347 RepID=A0A8J1T7J1_OWEFU|nr:unnamed protein product [Owenia fusiformis]
MLPKGLGIKQDPQSWSRPVYIPKAEFIKGVKTKSWTVVNDSVQLLDMLVANTAKDFMTELTVETPSKPFFLGVGFYKPHLPWVFPKRYLEYYPEGAINLPSNPDPQKNMPEVAWTGHASVFNPKYRDIAALNYTGEMNESRLPDDITKQLRRAYCTSISYIDDLVGDVLKHLDATGQANNTIIAFFSDHGWHLGENSRWGKATSFHLNARAPLMVHIPGTTDNGGTTNEKVEFVDIFPTLLEAAGIPPIQKCPHNSHDVELCRDGQSFMPLIKQPDLSWKEAVFWQVRGRQGRMGYTVFTGKYRYTIWTDALEGPVKITNSGILAEELYNHTEDPYETNNITDGGKYKTRVRRLLSRLRKLLKSAFNKGIYNDPENNCFDSTCK